MDGIEVNVVKPTLILVKLAIAVLIIGLVLEGPQIRKMHRSVLVVLSKDELLGPFETFRIYHKYSRETKYHNKDGLESPAHS